MSLLARATQYYTVTVRTDAGSWVTIKRYSDFYRLRAAVCISL
jgi:hypothetical protein